MYFLSGSDDDTLKLWDIENITLIRTFEGHKGDIVDIEVLAGNEQFLSASEDNTARLWDLKTGKVLRTYTDAQDVRIVKLLEDSKHFISISYPFLVKLRSLESDEEEVIYSNEDFLPLWASRFSDSNQIVISVQAEERHKLFFLDADTREVFISDNYNENLWAIEVLPGSDMALSGCTDDIVLLDFSALRHFKRKHRKIDG
jgi:WD40 repeat protein